VRSFPQSEAPPDKAFRARQFQERREEPICGSVPGEAEFRAFMRYDCRDAITRGLKQNLGLLLSNSDIARGRGTALAKLSALLPHVTAEPIADSQINLPSSASRVWRAEIRHHCPIFLFR